jgi:predicted nuclease with TOPRIM domain
MGLNTDTISQAFTALIIGLVGVAMGLQKIIKSWKTTSAETSVVELLHTELDRLCKQNTQLAVELNKLQIEVIALNKELRNLTAENQRLHMEVGALTSEVSRLQTMLKQGGS